MSEIQPIKWSNGNLLLLDQRILPHSEQYVSLCDLDSVAEAIRNMTVRGAPAIGITAAFGIVLAARGDDYKTLEHELVEAANLLLQTRPTAVNLRWGVERMLSTLRRLDGEPTQVIKQTLLKEAQTILEEDLLMNQKIGEFGSKLLPQNSVVLTHCNAGALATGGYGTALGVIRSGYRSGRIKHVFVDETRPRLQGARLTAWELTKEGIPMTLISDNMAAHLMGKREINAVIVGADRITSRGDTANKIGTYGLAIVANYHQIPFYVAAPSSTIDFSLESGSQIPIEERSVEEVLYPQSNRVESIAPIGVRVKNPAFDVTPPNLISAIITERGVFRPPYHLKA